MYLTEKLLQIIYSKKQEISIHQTEEKMLSHEEHVNSENFLLTSVFLQKAFANLSKKKDTIKKENLLYETKRLLQKHIIKQTKANQPEEA